MSHFILPPRDLSVPSVNLQAHLIAKYPTKMRGYGKSSVTVIQYQCKTQQRLVW